MYDAHAVVLITLHTTMNNYSNHNILMSILLSLHACIYKICLTVVYGCMWPGIFTD